MQTQLKFAALVLFGLSITSPLAAQIVRESVTLKRLPPRIYEKKPETAEAPPAEPVAPEPSDVVLRDEQGEVQGYMRIKAAPLGDVTFYDSSYRFIAHFLKISAYIHHSGGGETSADFDNLSARIAKLEAQIAKLGAKP
jgi:hypothetical protein